MSEQKTTGKFIFTVLLPSGKEIPHEYELPLDRKKFEEFVDSMVDMVFDALTKGKPNVLLFSNPTSVYNPANVSGVKVSFIGPVELEEVTERLRRKMGFVKD